MLWEELIKKMYPCCARPVETEVGGRKGGRRELLTRSLTSVLLTARLVQNSFLGKR